MKRRPRTPLTDDRRAMAEGQIRLAWKIARRFIGRYPTRRDEVLSAAYYGLVTAAEAYDPAAGFAFSTLAYRRIIGEIRTALRAPRPCGYRGPDRSEAVPATVGGVDAVALDPSAGRDVEAVDDRDLASYLLGLLTPRESLVLRSIYDRGMTQCEVARGMGVTQTAVSYIATGAIATLGRRSRVLLGGVAACSS